MYLLSLLFIMLSFFHASAMDLQAASSNSIDRVASLSDLSQNQFEKNCTKILKGDSLLAQASVAGAQANMPSGSLIIPNFMSYWSEEIKESWIFKNYPDDDLVISYSPDQKLIASAGRDGTLDINSSGKNKNQFKGHEGRINSVQWNAQSSLILSASDDNTVRIWDALLGSEKKKYECPGRVLQAIWSPDNNFIAACSSYGSVRIWDVQTDDLLELRPDAGVSISRIAFSRFGQMISAVCSDANCLPIIYIWYWPYIQKVRKSDFQDLVSWTSALE